IYLLACRLFDRRAGLVAAAIAAVAPFQVYYAQEARMYALLGLAATTMTYFFARAWTGNRRLDWIAFGLSGAVTLYAHNLGVMFVAGLDLWIAWMWLTKRAWPWPDGHLCLPVLAVRPGRPRCRQDRRWHRLRAVILSHL